MPTGHLDFLAGTESESRLQFSLEATHDLPSYQTFTIRACTVLIRESLNSQSRVAE